VKGKEGTNGKDGNDILTVDSCISKTPRSSFSIPHTAQCYALDRQCNRGICTVRLHGRLREGALQNYHQPVSLTVQEMQHWEQTGKRHKNNFGTSVSRCSAMTERWLSGQ